MRHTDKLRNMASVILTRDDNVLMLYRQGSRIVNELWVASAGGHFEKEELNDPRACALRELSEELGLTEDSVEDLSLRYITLRDHNGEIRQNYYFFARLKDSVNEELTSNEGVCRWFPLDSVRELSMPVSAKHMMEHYLKTGRYNSSLYAIVTAPDGAVCTEIKKT